MNKFKFLLFLLFIPFSVSAACNSTQLSRYKSLAAHINNYYDFNGSSFDVTFYNVSSDLKIVNKSNNEQFTSNSNLGDVVVHNIAPGSNINFAVYPVNGCPDYRVYTIYVNVPYLNSYYNDPVCNNNDNVLCSKWVNTSMYTYDQFVSQVKKDVKEEDVEQEPEVVAKKYGFFDFLADYYIIILLSIIVLGSISIYYLDKKSKFDF